MTNQRPRLKNVVRLNTGCSTLHPRPYVALEHLASGTGNLGKDIELYLRRPRTNGMASVEPGDVLFGKLRPYLAKSWLADQRVLASTELFCLRPTSCVDSRWLGYLVRSIPFVMWAVASSEGTKMPRTSWEKLGQFRLNLPSLVTQRKIAEYLDVEATRIDALISKKRRLIEHLDERRQAVITAVVTGKIASGDDLATLMSSGDLGFDLRQDQLRENRPLRAYAEVHLGRQRSPQHDTGPYMTAYLRAANVKDGALDLSDVNMMNFEPEERDRFSLQRGDVLVSEGSGSLAAVGASVVWNGEIEGTVCFQNTLLRLQPRASTDPRFLAWWCRYAYTDGLFASVAQGANIHHISADRVRSLPMAFVPPAMQQAIADYLDTETSRIDAIVKKENRTVDLLVERRQALITAMVTGEMSVPGVEA